VSAYAVAVQVLTSTTGATGNVAYCNSRVYPGRLPQNATLPAEVYQIISVNREHAMNADPGHARARLQVDIYDDTYLGTASGSGHVRSALSRFSGTTTGGVHVFDIFTDNERDALPVQLEDGGRTVWRRSLDFIAHYQE